MEVEDGMSAVIAPKRSPWGSDSPTGDVDSWMEELSATLREHRAEVTPAAPANDWITAPPSESSDAKQPAGRTDITSAGNDPVQQALIRPSSSTRELLKAGIYSVEEVLAFLNARYFVADAKGAAPIAQLEEDGSIAYISLNDLKIKHANLLVQSDRGAPRKAVETWLAHEDRKTLKIVFDPKAPLGTTIPGIFNVWGGFAVKPSEGWRKQRRLMHHIWIVICRRNSEKFRYLIFWLAWCVQHPNKAPEVVVVLKSRVQGTGKTTVLVAMRRLFGKHARVISDKQRLFGRFNSDLETVCFIEADEMLWAGDRSAADALKSLITTDTLTLEVKNGPSWQMPNRLHIMMTTNHDHAVQAGAHERRFFVLDVSPEKAQDRTWFGPLYDDLDSGGLEQFLWLLLNLDLDSWHPRQMPKTAETVEQQRFSADNVSQWAQACIEADAIIGNKNGISRSLAALVPSHELYEAYTGHCRNHPVGATAFGKALTAMFGPPSRHQVTGSNSNRRPRTYQVPDADAWQRALDEWQGINRKA
jgi:Family of unknown function (DUF5906)